MAGTLTTSSSTVSLFGATVPSGIFAGSLTTTSLFTDRFNDRVYIDVNTVTSFEGQVLGAIEGSLSSSIGTVFGFNGLVGSVGSVALSVGTETSFSNTTIYGTVTLDDSSKISFNGQVSYDGVLNLNLESTVGFFATIPDSIAGVLDSIVNTIVFNQRTTGVSEYTKFNFNSFFAIGNDYYGVASDGIYLLGGSSDEASYIAQSKITTGVSDFKTQKLKAITDGYAYIRSSGDMTVQMTTNEQTQRTEYPLYYDGIDGIHRRRVKVAKGIKGTSWQAEIRNEDGAEFTIKQLDLVPQELDRSI